MDITSKELNVFLQYIVKKMSQRMKYVMTTSSVEKKIGWKNLIWSTTPEKGLFGYVYLRNKGK